MSNRHHTHPPGPLSAYPQVASPAASSHGAIEANRRRWLLAGWAGLGALALGGCASRGVAPEVPVASPSAPEDPARQRLRQEIAWYALSLLDTRYAWGGRGPATGFDCSGLVSHVYREAAGMDIRGSSAAMARMSRPLEPAALQAGDLVFFNTLGAAYSHVGLYVGNQRFVHASNERTGVRMDGLGHRYYAARFEGARTLLG